MHYDHVLTALAASPWAIEPIRGREIAAVLNARLRDGRGDPAGIEAARSIRESRAAAAGDARGSVALIPVVGALVQHANLFTEVSGLMSTTEIGQQIDLAVADPKVSTILLNVDSPGGSVFGTAELADKVYAARRIKPVIAAVNSLAASAGYWIASQASSVVVTPGGQVGSIGVYVMHVDRSEEARRAGQSVTFVATSPEKVAGNPYQPLDDAGRAEIEQSVMGYYAMFLAAVARGRGVSAATVKAKFGGGGMLLAPNAVVVGAADAIGTLDAVAARYGLSFTGVPGRPQVGPPPADPGLAARRKQLAADARQIARPPGRAGVEVRRRRMLLDAAPSRPAAAAVPYNPDPLRTAFHEAGHAVVACLLGATGLTVSVVPEKGSNGRVNYSPLKPTDEATVCYAGVLAERHLPADHPPAGYAGGERDRRTAAERCPSELDREVAREARALVAEHGPAIRRVAARLLTAKTLTGGQVAALVRAG